MRATESRIWRYAFIALALSTPLATMAQPAAAASPPASVASSARKIDRDALIGAWSRPDGGYTIVIKKVGPGGDLDATYYRPTPLPFSRAHASWDGKAMTLAFEIRDGGYNGSTYDLRYDAATDRLVGTYFQAVAKEKYEIYFVRK